MIKVLQLLQNALLYVLMCVCVCVFVCRPGEDSQQPGSAPPASQKEDHCDDNGKPLSRKSSFINW